MTWSTIGGNFTMGRINFVKQHVRQPLTAQEVNYWKLNLSRILKVGAEFEFNLPDKPTGICTGKSFSCPCIHYGSAEKDCWRQCLKEHECSTNAHISRCNNFVEEKCTADKCISCTNYSFKCHGTLCSNYTSACLTCDDFELDCDKCEYRFDPTKNPDSIRTACINEFAPINSYGILSRSGVHHITTDGSLLGKKGMEIITTGRRVDFWEFYNMSKNIIDTSVKNGAYINERCSIHMHVLAAYYGQISGPSGSNIKELERNVPEIILANLHQLIRRYQNAITWMSSGLNNPAKLTRWEKFRVSVLNISAVANSMRDVKSMVESVSNGTKYGWVNYKFCTFDGNGDINRLHIEFRVMDGLLSPSACAAFACLYYAMFIKAVELSKYGIMEVGDDAWKAKALKIKSALLNNCSDWQDGNKYGRFSDTSEVYKYTDTLVAESFELISQLKHILTLVGPAYDVLEKLAENPCSIRRCANTCWEDIENDLKVELTTEGKIEYEIGKLVDTRAITGEADKQTWIEKVSSALADNKKVNVSKKLKEEIYNSVCMYVEEKQTNGEMIWADRIGSMIMI